MYHESIYHFEQKGRAVFIYLIDFLFLTHFETKLPDGEWNQLLHHIV